MHGDPSPGAGRSRMSAQARRSAILDLAAEAFAEHGFALSTRDIAMRCGITQALIYKHFASKEALIEAVFERRFLDPRPGPDAALLGTDAPLWQRIGAFYVDFARGAEPINLRLFLRAALDGLGLPRRYAGRLDERVLRPVLSALRKEIGAPPPGPGPLPPIEREIAMSLHAAIVFTLIRREIYRITFPVPLHDLIMIEARIWAPGAIEELQRVSSRR